MSKAKRKAVPKPQLTLIQKFIRGEKRLLAGKRAYKEHDMLVDSLEAEVQAGFLQVGAFIDLGNGKRGRLVDKFEGKNRIGYGGAARRYEIEIVNAEDLSQKL